MNNHIQENPSPSPRGSSGACIGSGDTFTDHFNDLSINSSSCPEESAVQALQLFLVAQDQGLKLSSATLSRIYCLTKTLPKRRFHSNPAVQQIFRAILSQAGRVGLVLRQMHVAGLLNALIPPFNRLIRRAPREFFHQHTVDEHTLLCVDHLDQIWNRQNTRLFNVDFYTEMFRQVTRPDLLYLAVLLHDIGKGLGGDHSIKGARIASIMGRRLGFGAEDVIRLNLLVLHHLTLVVMSQKRDLDDPEVTCRLARLVGDTENLRMLTLLTVADALGTNETLWNGFKDALLRTLYSRTLQLMTGTVIPEAEARRRALQDKLEATPDGFTPMEIEAHFNGMPESYFHHITLGELIADLYVIREFLVHQADGRAPPEPVAISQKYIPVPPCTIIRVCTNDQLGLFAKLVSSLSASGIDILRAEAYTRSDRLVLDRFYVTETGSDGLVRESTLIRFLDLVKKALSGVVELPELLCRARTYGTLAPACATTPPRITFDNQASAKRTVLEVQTHDRSGLLAVLASTLAELGVDISLAKVNTHRGIADDAFYVTESNGQPILASERQELIRARLTSALAELS